MKIAGTVTTPYMGRRHLNALLRVRRQGCTPSPLQASRLFESSKGYACLSALENGRISIRVELDRVHATRFLQNAYGNIQTSHERVDICYVPQPRFCACD